MATTSGVVGRTQLDVTKTIEHAFRRCGKLASTISSELQMSALSNLNFILSSLANRGLSLWCVRKSILGVQPFKKVYALPEGTVDVLNCLYRTKTDYSGSVISGTTWSGLDLGSAQRVHTASVRFTETVSSPTLVLESSSDNVTWATRQAFPTPLALAAGEWLCVDMDNAGEARYWRVRETIDPSIAAGVEVLVSDEGTEIDMGLMNRDDYTALPNKSFSVSAGQRGLNYWFDKQIAPQLWIWPLSEGDNDQLVVWNQRQIQDAVSFIDLVEVPQRWHNYVVFELARYCALEIPANELPPGRYELLKGEAAEALLSAEDGESDGSPIRIQMNISGYTA